MTTTNKHILDVFDPRIFLQEYWQKAPCVIKQFIPDFTDPIDEHDLAGLAQEEEVDSRIVSCNEGEWQATQGPFDDFEKICRGNWTILVQGVDRYINEVSELSEQVKFIPNWRFDDVMVSYSVTGAGVGAHTDEYDVFIVQGKGSRRWQVGVPKSDYKHISPHPLLKLIDGFEPIIDYELQSGDAIYIPPKHPHKGQTLSNCLNYSIGFRAPTNLELLQGVFDYGEALSDAQVRYSDPNLVERRGCADVLKINSAEVSNQELTHLKQSMLALLESDQAQQAILSFLSRQELPDNKLEYALTYSEVYKFLVAGKPIYKAPGVKPIYASTSKNVKRHAQNTNNVIESLGVFQFFIDGEVFEVNASLAEHVKDMIAQEYITNYPANLTSSQKKQFVSLVTELINAGYWYFVDD